MAIYQSTNLPAVSLPRDIFQIPPESLILFSQFDKIYIWMDNTIQGQNASIQFARKLGLNRCQLIKPTEHDQNPPFNALDAVYKKLNIQEWLDRSQPYTHQNILGFSALRDSVFMEVMNSEQAKGVPSNDFPALSQIIKGLRPGELTIFSGPTGSGKTTFLSQISLDYCKSGVSTLWGSFEINNVRLVKKMLYQYAGFSLQGDFEQYKEWAEKFNTLPLYFLKFFGTTPIHRVIEAMQHAVEAYDVQHFIIDNLQFMTSGLGKGFEKWDIQDNALTQFRQFATNYNVHVTLVVHPKKDDRGFLDINSVFGSAKVTQEADNVIFIQNGPNKLRFIDVKKNRFDGTVGMVPLKFDPESNRILQLNEEELNELKRYYADIGGKADRSQDLM
ncbi:P-loop containing nucleoside triphosphate hydrolase protein [Conidiobolus coronatus NRRL 28638]|uniref:p-loop containing nucleoside triphosphate hydrolase protein n=1 Tax=Conidiobolus coronatus (strain ATCC 28846 / CBS 209.66 / NRRL 28638) TaxID=796925 RepID=A0A137PC59_CONC2|nr:P-loop containing nucleoside triphosphate hydrolase protein [Conidiobolus coronatus NRRL 28638]|eukprot:KXN72555.1 P-loop containing nucleoside triphosphate hydrolase protein [Conidiobolus coronatus NRRL 28638]